MKTTLAFAVMTLVTLWVALKSALAQGTAFTYQGRLTDQGHLAGHVDDVWAAGIQAPPWLAQMDGLEVNRANQLVVDTRLVTTHDPDVFALGDCAACPWPGHGKPGAIVPPRAQAAHQQAMLLVRSMTGRLAGKPLPEYHYRDFGSMVSLGAVSAVGSLMGRLIGGSLLVQGLIARWMYVSLYKLHQIAIHGYLRVGLDTLSRIVRHRLGSRVKLH